MDSSNQMDRVLMRIVSTLLLLMVAASACAGWVRAVVTEDDDVVYIDPATIRRIGNLRRVWVVQDLEKKGPRGERSRKVFWEYDCVARKYRGLSIASYSGPMATEQVLESVDTASGWIEIAPGTADATILGAVCAP
jgi:hypothetical protein